MMSNLKPREKMLLGLTILGFVILVAWQMGLDTVFDSAVSGTSDTASLEGKFRSNLQELSRMYLIEREYKRIGDFPIDGDEKLRPALAFTQQVSDICRNLGFEFQPIRPEAREIEGVDDYELINVSIKTEGTFANTIKLFKEFERRGLIFREVQLTSPRDRDVLVSRVTVARIAPVEKASTTRRSTRTPR